MGPSKPTHPPVLVTGANRGLGRAIAGAMSRAGHPVVVGARRLTDAAEASASLVGATLAVELDITDQQSVDHAVERSIDRFASLGVLVNNAGGHYDIGVPASSVTDRAALAALELNLIGTWRMMNAVIPGMRRHQWGRIVNISSRSGSFAESDSRHPHTACRRPRSTC